jgi:hypothetical protein
MRASPVSLTLLLGSTVAFAPTALNRADFHSNRVARRRNSHRALYNNVPTPTFPLVATQTPSLTLVKIENMKEAKQYLQQIEASATKAREYLMYLNEVAQVVRSYLQDQATPLRANFHATELQNVQEAKEYLVNIEKATASALEYLKYLENMTNNIKLYLQKFQTENAAGNVSDQKVQQAQEAKTYLNDLEETARAAKDYLVYLQTVADVVQQYLVDPNLKGIQEFLPSNLAENLIPPRGMQSAVTTPVMPVPAVTSKSLIETVQNTATPPVVTRQGAPLEILRPQQRLKPPPARPLEVDDMMGPRPVLRIDRPEGTAGADYLKSLRSSTTPSTTVSDTNLNYLETLASEPRTNGVVPTKPVESYLDAIAPSMQTKMIATKKEIVSTVEQEQADRKREAEKKAQKEAEKKVEKALEVQKYLDDLQAQYLENLEATARAAKEHLAYLQSVDPIVRTESSMPVIQTPTHHFAKSFADSTPFSEATPAERGRSDVSHMDQMDDAILNGAAPLSASYFEAISEKCDADKPPEPCGVAITNYLDALSSNQVAPSPVTGAAITSYLDSLSRKALVGTSTSATAVTSYLDGLFSGSIASPKSSAAVTSYLEAISSGSEATPPNSGAIKSYLDALSSGSASVGSSGAGVPSYTDRLNGAAPTVETPTSHFNKGFADSTPYSEAGPPEKGRSDVSHMDQMDDLGAAYMDEIGSIASPTVESPTQHFSKGFADSTPYSEAGPREKGRSDVSHMDRIDDARGSYLDSLKIPATSRTGSFSKDYGKTAAGTGTFGKAYLETKGTTTSDPLDWSSGKGKPIIIGDATPSTGAYLDQFSSGSSQSIKRAPSTKKYALGSDSYLDQMPSASESIDWSSFAGASITNEAAPTTGSYMDQISRGSNQPDKRAPPSKKIAPGSGSYLDEMPAANESIDWSSAAGESPIKATRSATSYLEQIMASSQKGVPIDLSRAPKNASPTGSYLQSIRRASAANGSPQYFYLEEGVKKFFFSKLDPVKGASVKTKREAVLGSKYMAELIQAARNNPRLSSDQREQLQPEWDASTSFSVMGNELDKQRFVLDNNAKDTQSQLDGIEKELASQCGSNDFAEFAELINGRVAMFFLIFGLVVELFTGLTFPVQVVTILQISQVKDGYEQLAKISGAARQLAQSRIDAAIQTFVQKPEVTENVIEPEQGSVEMAQELLKSSEAIQQLAQPEVDAAAQVTVHNSAPDVPEEGAEKVAEASQSSVETVQELAKSSSATPPIVHPGVDTGAGQNPAPNVPEEVAETVAEASQRSLEIEQELAKNSGATPPIAQPGVDTGAAQNPAPDLPQEVTEKVAESSESNVEMAQLKSSRATPPTAKDAGAAQNPAQNVPQEVAEKVAEASQGSTEVTQVTESTIPNLDDLTF